MPLFFLFFQQEKNFLFEETNDGAYQKNSATWTYEIEITYVHVYQTSKPKIAARATKCCQVVSYGSYTAPENEEANPKLRLQGNNFNIQTDSTLTSNMSKIA